MEDKRIKAFFEQQTRAILGRSATQPGGFRAYFAEREPKDNEILGLLAISVMMSGDFPLRSRYASPIEALAALSKSARAELCRQFRSELKACLRQMGHA